MNNDETANRYNLYGKRNWYNVLLLLNLLVWGIRPTISENSHYSIGILLLLTLIKEIIISAYRSKQISYRWIYFEPLVQHVIVTVFLASTTWSIPPNLLSTMRFFRILSFMIIIVLVLFIYLGRKKSSIYMFFKQPLFFSLVFFSFALSTALVNQNFVMTDQWQWATSLAVFYVLYVLCINGRLYIGKTKSEEESTARIVILYYCIMLLWGTIKSIC